MRQSIILLSFCLVVIMAGTLSHVKELNNVKLISITETVEEVKDGKFTVPRIVHKIFFELEKNGEVYKFECKKSDVPNDMDKMLGRIFNRQCYFKYEVSASADVLGIGDHRIKPTELVLL